MANAPLIPSMNRQTRSVIRDVYGHVILELGMTEAMIVDGNGNMTKQRLSDNVALVCGGIYNPGMSVGQNPVMLIGVCQPCREPPPRLFREDYPTHGLCSKESGTNCRDCGIFLCPRHTRRGEDGCPRCDCCARRAARWSTIRKVVDWAFFKEL